MCIGVGFAMLPDESLFGRSPPAGAWIALSVLVAMMAAYYLLVHRGGRPRRKPCRSRNSSSTTHRVWMLVALLGPGLAVFSGARPLAVAWWLVAGPAFSTVPLVSASLLALILTHPREVLFVLPAQRVGAWVITGVLLVHHWADDDAAAEAA